MISRVLVASIAASCALPAAALVIRPDRDDSEYLELATHYASAIAFPAPGGEGVLVAPRWVLTTGTRARNLQAAKGVALPIAGRRHEIEAFFFHPDAKLDAALLYLREPVRGVEPARLYRGTDEAGDAVAVLGHAGGRKRAGINTVDRVTPTSIGLRIKPPAEASDLQAAATREETGAPAFIGAAGGRAVAGILQSIDGEWQNYVRASAIVDWLESTLLEAAKKEAEALLGAN
ncbi:MAG TPA: hypothetical protein VEC19_09555 [Usitatibacter sp.]|nr:hypothetical protein [Usitatibacter sp.]